VQIIFREVFFAILIKKGLKLKKSRGMLARLAYIENHCNLYDGSEQPQSL
jgi:hypothetical protein